jgi:protein-disulfide isomerase
MAQNEASSRGPAWIATLWPLLTGLAIGFLVGKEVGSRHGGQGGDGETAAAVGDSKAPAGTKMPAKIYKSESEFPQGWTKSADLASVNTVAMTDLTTAQKVTVMQALNERDCECGCGMGKIAGCIKKDPNCPRSPNLARAAIDLVKQGKGLGEILAAIDDKQKPSGGSPSKPSEPAAGGSKKVVPMAHDLRRGAAATKVTIVEFSDFQCPFCKRAVPTLHEIEQKYPKDVAVVFVNQPLPFHDKAMGAAQAFMAAARQGKAWEMHDKMFSNQQALSEADLDKYAQEIGLNMAKFKAAMDSSKFKDRIQKDSAEGMKVGANGTPTFFINGNKVEGAQPFDAFKAVIDRELAKK